MRQEPDAEEAGQVDLDEDVEWAPARGGHGAWQLGEPLGRWAGAPSARGPADGVIYAEFGLRAAAFAIDLAILFLLMRAAAELMNRPYMLLTPGPDGSIDAVPLLLLGLAESGLALLIGASVVVYSWRVLRASPGQLAIGLSTLRHDDGAHVGTATALLRWILVFAPAVFVTGAPRAIVGNIVWTYPSWLYDFFGLAPLLVLAWYVILGITTLNDPRGRGLLDRLAGTAVVRETD